MGKTRKDKKDGMDVLPVGHLGQPPFRPGCPASTRVAPGCGPVPGEAEGTVDTLEAVGACKTPPGAAKGMVDKDPSLSIPSATRSLPGIEATLWNGPRIRWGRRATHRGP